MNWLRPYSPEVLWVATMLVAAAASGCEAGSKAGKEAQMQGKKESVQALSDELSVWLPPNCTVLGVDRQHGMDDIVQAKLNMTRNDLEAFLRRLPIDPEAFQSAAGGTLSGGPAWWDPPASIRVGQTMLEGARGLHVGIDDRQHDSILVYIVNHGT